MSALTSVLSLSLVQQISELDWFRNEGRGGERDALQCDGNARIAVHSLHHLHPRGAHQVRFAEMGRRCLYSRPPPMEPYMDSLIRVVRPS
jgi:hypothetical protein